jgi:hypothetical protein
MEHKHVIYTAQRNLNRAKPTHDPAENGNRDFPSDATHGAPDRYATTARATAAIASRTLQNNIAVQESATEFNLMPP